MRHFCGLEERQAQLRSSTSYLQDQIPQVVEKAAASEGDTPEAQRRATACGRALDLHLSRLRCAVRIAAFSVSLAPRSPSEGELSPVAVHLKVQYFYLHCNPMLYSSTDSSLLQMQKQAWGVWPAGPGRPVRAARRVPARVWFCRCVQASRACFVLCVNGVPQMCRHMQLI